MIKTVKLKQFGRFASFRLDLNPSVTAITGPNGSGKSTLLEALMYGVWGLQRRKMTRPGTAVQVIDENDEYVLRTESESGGSVSLNGKAKTTKTKAVELISERYGAPNAWKQCLYINNKTVARFSQSRPAELKALIQDMLQSKELQQLRLQLTEANKGLKETAHGKNLCAKTQEARVRMARNELKQSADAWTSVNAKTSYKQLKTKLADAGAALSVANNEYAIAKERSKGASREEYRLFYYDMSLLNPVSFNKELQAVQRAAKNNQDMVAYNCTTCGANIGDEIAKAKENEVRSRRARVVQLEEQHQLFNTFLASEKQKGLREEYDAAKREFDKCEDHLQQYVKLSSRVPDLFANYCKELAQYGVDRAQAAMAANEMSVCSEAIDICTHAQALQLQRVMQRVTSYANSYLAAIAAPFNVQMDESGIVVCSDRGKQTYDSLSAGEARRVDVCLCLAAAMVSAEVGSLPLNAPVVIDEAFDTLDASGIESILNLLYEVAKTRQVILVTHADVSFATSGQLSHIKLE